MEIWLHPLLPSTLAIDKHIWAIAFAYNHITLHFPVTAIRNIWLSDIAMRRWWASYSSENFPAASPPCTTGPISSARKWSQKKQDPTVADRFSCILMPTVLRWNWTGVSFTLSTWLSSSPAWRRLWLFLVRIRKKNPLPVSTAVTARISR